MSAEVIPFPKTKNRPFICKQAAQAAGMSEKGGNNYLRIQLDKQRDTMERRGQGRCDRAGLQGRR